MAGFGTTEFSQKEEEQPDALEQMRVRRAKASEKESALNAVTTAAFLGSILGAVGTVVLAFSAWPFAIPLGIATFFSGRSFFKNVDAWGTAKKEGEDIDERIKLIEAADRIRLQIKAENDNRQALAEAISESFAKYMKDANQRIVVLETEVDRLKKDNRRNLQL